MSSAKGNSCMISGVELDTDAKRTKAPWADTAVLCKADLIFLPFNPFYLWATVCLHGTTFSMSGGLRNGLEMACFSV